MNTFKCFAVRERVDAPYPDPIIHLTDSAAQAQNICHVKNGDSIKLTDTPRYYIGVTGTHPESLQ